MALPNDGNDRKHALRPLSTIVAAIGIFMGTDSTCIADPLKPQPTAATAPSLTRVNSRPSPRPTSEPQCDSPARQILSNRYAPNFFPRGEDGTFRITVKTAVNPITPDGYKHIAFVHPRGDIFVILLEDREGLRDYNKMVVEGLCEFKNTYGTTHSFEVSMAAPKSDREAKLNRDLKDTLSGLGIPAISNDMLTFFVKADSVRVNFTNFANKLSTIVNAAENSWESISAQASKWTHSH
ncbi:MAG TPA: hypothetical protein VGZ00_11780 [Candidatus Baltobacteraceae bacterium]|jgi:hypothetical protein|nr:hypothetical protein [Candidatus Baltobacteraceae bacterium]